MSSDKNLKDIIAQLEFNYRKKNEILLFKIDFMLENLLLMNLNKIKMKNKENFINDIHEVINLYKKELNQVESNITNLNFKFNELIQK